MSTLSNLAAWQILGGHSLRSAAGPEDELVVVDALSVVARELGLESEAAQIAHHASDLRRVNAMRTDLRDYFDGQLKLNLGGTGDGNGGGDGK